VADLLIKGVFFMKRITRIAIALFVTVYTGPAYGRVGAEYLKWASGEFEMPPALKEAQARSQLEPFLQDKDEFLRMAAVRRLGEIEGPKAAAQLQEIARKERSPEGPDYVPLVKLEVVRVLDRLQGPEAESALIDLFNDYWARRADVQRDRAFRLYDFRPVGSTLLDALDKRANSKPILKTIEKPALSRDVAEKGILPDWFRQRVWEVYLRGQMIHSEAADEADQVEGLLNQLNLIERKWPFDYLSLDHIKALAARGAIGRYDDVVLHAVDARIDQAMVSRSYEKAPDPKRRYQELADNRSCVRKILKDRAQGRNVSRPRY